MNCRRRTAPPGDHEVLAAADGRIADLSNIDAKLAMGVLLVAGLGRRGRGVPRLEGVGEPVRGHKTLAGVSVARFHDPDEVYARIYRPPCVQNFQSNKERRYDDSSPARQFE